MTFVQARWYTPNGMGRVRALGLHSGETPDNINVAENMALWFERHPGFTIINGKRVTSKPSAHAVADADSTVECVKDLDSANHMGGANSFTLGLEQAGFARQTRAEWLDPYGRRMIKEQTAPWCVAKLKKFNLPFHFLTEEEIRDNPSGFEGIMTHGLWNLATDFKHSTHWDPGVEYPLDFLGECIADLWSPITPVHGEEEFMEIIQGDSGGRNADGSVQGPIGILSAAGLRPLEYAEWDVGWKRRVDRVVTMAEWNSFHVAT